MTSCDLIHRCVRPIINWFFQVIITLAYKFLTQISIFHKNVYDFSIIFNSLTKSQLIFFFSKIHFCLKNFYLKNQSFINFFQFSLKDYTQYYFFQKLLILSFERGFNSFSKIVSNFLSKILSLAFKHFLQFYSNLF